MRNLRSAILLGATWVGEGGHAGRLPILPRPAAQLSLYYPQWCHWSQSGPFRQ